MWHALGTFLLRSVKMSIHQQLPVAAPFHFETLKYLNFDITLKYSLQNIVKCAKHKKRLFCISLLSLPFLLVI